MKTLAFLFSFLLPFFCFSQLSGLTTNFGDQIKYDIHAYKWVKHINSKGAIVGIRLYDTGFDIVRYQGASPSLSSLRSYEKFYISQKIENRYFNFRPRFYALGDHLYLLAYKKIKGGWELNSYEVNFSTGTISEQGKPLLSPKEDIGYIDFAVSTDNKRLIASYLYTKDIRKHPRIGYCVIDEQSNIIQSEVERVAPFPLCEYNDDVNFFADSKQNIYLAWYPSKSKDSTCHLYMLSKGASAFSDVSIRGHVGVKPYFHFDENTDGTYLSAYGSRGFPFFAEESANVALYKLSALAKTAEIVIESPLVFDSIYDEELYKFLHNEFGGVVKSGTYLFKPKQLITLKDNSKFIIGSAETGEKFEAGFVASYIDATGKYQWTKHIFSYYWTNDRQRDFLIDEDRKILYIARSYKDAYTKNSVSKEVFPDIRITALNANGKITDKVIRDQASGISNITKINEKELDVEVLLYSTDDNSQVVAQPIKITLK